MAPTRDALFAASLEAFTDCLTDLSSVARVLRRRVSLRAASPDLLLVEWLGELLYAFEVRRELFAAAETRVEEDADGLRLTAELEGERFDPARHPIRFVLKAVTYHELTVEPRREGWLARVIFDI